MDRVRDFEKVTFLNSESGLGYREAAVYRELGQVVILGRRNKFKYARNFTERPGGASHHMAVVRTERGASYAISNGRILTNGGRLERIPDVYRSREPLGTGGGSIPAINLPDITIGDVWDLEGTNSSEAGSVSEVWVNLHRAVGLGDESAAERSEPGAPPFDVYAAVINNAVNIEDIQRIEAEVVDQPIARRRLFGLGRLLGQ